MPNVHYVIDPELLESGNPSWDGSPRIRIVLMSTPTVCDNHPGEYDKMNPIRTFQSLAVGTSSLARKERYESPTPVCVVTLQYLANDVGIDFDLKTSHKP
jgi:hypothetical protein